MTGWSPPPHLALLALLLTPLSDSRTIRASETQLAAKADQPSATDRGHQKTPVARPQAEPSAARLATGTSGLRGKSLVEQIGLDQHLGAQIPLDLEFRDEQGAKVQLREYFRDRPVILNLVYYRCPMLCNQVLNGLLEATQGLPLLMGKDYHVISVSIDPRETPELAVAKKKRYVESYRRPGAEQGWHFLTGDPDSIERLADIVGYRYVYDADSDQFAHASGIMLLTPDGRISRYFYGIDYYPTDLRLALVESSDHQIGSPVDQLLLLCFHYDPVTGRYGLIISNAIRAAGIVTMILLGGFLWLMYRQERDRSAAAVRQGLFPSPSELPPRDPP